MSRKIEIGAPSVGGKTANDTLKEVFSGAEYPLNVMVRNHLKRAIVLPEIGVFLQGGEIRPSKVANEHVFHRGVSSIEQIAALNGYKLAVTIEEAEAGASDPAPTAGAQDDTTATIKQPQGKKQKDAPTASTSDPAPTADAQ